ncbi:hypothetical protein O3299_07070 [Janthinobacterium sp. SUN176]|uniref:Uncharacterized protein n=1 Tax=Janthinobacterium kumbetense TaxID=2950280 RepID=A0ABT0WL76_9BURK|nr:MULTISPECIES: hypothetical protein [Janthinobacterium]MCM2564819.1 hypothetical protein [Janthinobacterium kumbetense]MDO8071281.1 hypothetical protein [Janthinobacterium sp. SUN176]
MSQFDNFLGFGSSDYDSDPYNTLGTGATVLPDVSWSSPAMETSTSTGNGFGDFFDSKAGNFVLGSLNTALNYAMYRDQRQFTAVANAPQQAVQQQVAVQQVRNNNLLLWAAIAAGLIFLVKK